MAAARAGLSRPGIVGAGVIVVAAILVGVLGSDVSRQASATIHTKRHAELAVIGGLKVGQITDWRSERVADAHVGASWPFTGAAVAGWLADRTDAALRADLVGRLDLLRHRHPGPESQDAQFEDVILASPDGSLLLSLDPDALDLGVPARRLATQVATSREAAMGDFDLIESSGQVYVDAAAPVVDVSGRTIAVLILRSDPNLRLYPMIQAWPTASGSAETLLVRRDGDSVLFLNVLRHTADPAMTFREPLSRTDSPAVAAVLGRVGEFEGPDYRGEAVLADLQRLPESPWFLVTKVDSAEVLAEVNDRRGAILLLGLLAVLLAGTGVALALSLRQNSLRQRLLRAERDRASATRLYERVLALARDPFVLLDASGRIVDANVAAVAAYGYSREELLKLNIGDLQAPDARATLEKGWEAAAGPDGVLFETVHRRRDGSTFPVEVSSRPIDVDGELHRQSFVRDITSRRAAEDQLRRLGAAHATLAETNEAIVRIRDEPTLYASICRIAVEQGGYLGAWIGVVEEPAKRIVPVATAGSIDGYIGRLHISTDPSQPEGQGPTALAVRDGRPQFCDDFLEDPATAPWHDLGKTHGIRASAALPLLRGGVPAGVLSLYAREPHVFDDQMRTLLDEMAADVSFALDGFEREAARRRAQEALESSQAVLIAQLEELRRWNDAMLGREERVIELKREVNELHEKLGEPPRYSTAARDAAADHG